MTRPTSERRGLLPLVSAWALGVATAVVLLVVLVRTDERATDAQTTVDTYAVQAKARAQQIAASDVCQSTDPRVVAQFGSLCAIAQDVAAQDRPDPIDTDALAAEVAAVVTAGLPARVDAAVAAYLTSHPPTPGRDATPEQVAAAVGEYLTLHPPEPGRPPTAGEIAAEVAAYLDRHPPPAGPDGEPGRPPTTEEIDAAVGAYLEAHPVQVCAEGEIREPYIYRDGRQGSRCVLPQGG